MAAATARAPAADKRWGFAAAAAAAAPTRTPAVGVVETAAPNPTSQSTQRGAFPWGDKPMPPAPNVWVSSSPLSLKNDGVSGSFGNISDRPSSQGSSGTSTDGSDLLDSPVSCDRASHNSTAAISHPRSTELRSGTWQFPHSQTSFTDVLNAPLKTTAKRRPTSHGKGFALSADDFPVLVPKNSQSNSQIGHSFQGRPTFSSVIIAARDEQRKIRTTGDPVSTTNFSMEAQQAQLHATQTPDVCLPPPCIDYWHPPPDHPPDSDRNGIWHGGAELYGPCKPAHTHGSFPVESCTHNGQSLSIQGGEERHGPVHGGYHPENNDFCYTHVPDNACVKGLPHLMHGKVKDNHSDALEKQVIKKDVALLEKIRFLNIKARKLRAAQMSGISSCRESKVERPRSMDVVANDAPVSANISYITSSFDMANSVSESSNHVLNGKSDMSSNLVMIDLSEGHATKFSEARKPGQYAANNLYGVGDTSSNKRDSAATDMASNLWGYGWEEHSTVDSLQVAMTRTHGDQQYSRNISQHVHMRNTDDMLNSPDYQIQHSRRELSAQQEKQLHEEERGKTQQKAKYIEKLEDLNICPLVQSQKSNGTPGKSADSHEYGGWNASRNKHGDSAEDISFNISGHGWEDHPAVESLPVMINSHQGQSIPWNTSLQVYAGTTDDIPSSPGYGIEHSRWRGSSAQHGEELQKKRENIQQNTTAIPANFNRSPFGHSQKPNDAPGGSDYHEYGGWQASRNRHGISAEDISFNMPGHGWEDHPTVDSLQVMTNTHQDQSFPENTSQQVHVRTADKLNSPGYETKHPRRKLYSQYAKRLPEQERWKIKQPVKSIAKLDDLNKHRFVQKRKSDDAPAKSAEYHVYGGNASVNRYGSSAEDVSFKISGLGWEDHPTVDSLPVLTNTNEDQSSPGNTTDSNTLEHTAWKSAAQSHDSSAPKHLQAEDSEGQVHKQESISRVSTPASDIADANKGPLVDNAIASAKNTDTNMIHIDQKGASESHDRTAPMHLQMQDKRKAHSQGRISRGLPDSEPAGVNKGFFTHNLIPSSQNNGINTTEHIVQRSASQSHESNAPEHLQMEIRRRQVRSEEGVLRERSSIADSTENATTIDGTLVDTWNSEAKRHADLSTQSKRRRPTSPLVFVTKNTETSRVHEAHISGVVINNAIIPVQASSIKVFTVGSIMLGDASLASVKQEKTVTKEVNDDVTHSCSSAKQTKQSGMNQHDEHHVNPHASGDSIMHTPVKDQSKKENSEVDGLNCTAIPACTQPSGNQSTVSQNVAPVETSQMERHTQTPACKELDLQNPRQMLPTENHTTSSGNSSESKLDTKTLDKEALDARTSTKAEVKTEPGSREDEKTKKHLGRSSASSKQGSTNGSASRAPDHYEQETNSFLKMMQELSDELKQVEKQLESSTSIDAATVNRLQPAQMVSLPGYTWGEYHMSHGHRQYHVDGQGNTWVNYAANSHPDGSVMAQWLALPTTHLLHNIYIPQNNVPGVNSAPGWSWDTAERLLISDMDDTQGFGTAITAKSGTAPAQNVLPRVSEMDVMLGLQAMGGMAYAPAASPEVLRHTGTELQQLNPTWFPHIQHNGRHHHGGTGVYFLGTDQGAATQTQGGDGYVAGPIVGPVQHPEYQLMPAVAPPVAAWTDGSAIVPAGYHPAEARGAVYYV